MSAEVVRLRRPGQVARKVAAEVRAEAARQQVPNVRLAAELHVSAASMSRRMNGRLPISLDELDAIATLLGVTMADLLPHRDSNTEPADQGTSHVRRLELVAS